MKTVSAAAEDASWVTLFLPVVFAADNLGAGCWATVCNFVVASFFSTGLAPAEGPFSGWLDPGHHSTFPLLSPFPQILARKRISPCGRLDAVLQQHWRMARAMLLHLVS